MKKKGVLQEAINRNVLRIANPRDIERLTEARGRERDVMIRSRVMARNLELDMKIGDVEFQADKRKATFYYIADGRVDFRELIKVFAREFRVKIEMRQIGARQESSRIGGIGSCGRELCCSTWLTNFKSVSTAAARYQNLAINQSKLSGQCGRLKCCLNYELDTYLDALKAFPRQADHLETEAGRAILVKTDIFRGLMFYVYEKSVVNKFYPVKIKRVKEIIAQNKKGIKPVDLQGTSFTPVEEETGFVDVTGEIELPPEERRRRKRGRGGKGRKGKGKSDRPSNNKKGGSSNKGGSSSNKGGSSSNKGGSSGNKSSRKPSGKPSGKPSSGKSGGKSSGGKQQNRRNEGRSDKGKQTRSGEAQGGRKPDNRKPKPQNKKGRGPRKSNRPTDKPKE